MIFECTFKSRNGLLESCLEKGPFKTHEIGLALITIQLTFKKKNIKKEKISFPWDEMFLVHFFFRCFWCKAFTQVVSYTGWKQGSVWGCLFVV
jgi:hypothetical protein